MSDRMKSFKNAGKDCDERRRHRTEEKVELRKAKKDEQLTKRRNINVHEIAGELDGDGAEAGAAAPMETAAAAAMVPSTGTRSALEVDVTPESGLIELSLGLLEEIQGLLNSPDPTSQHKGFQFARKALSRDEDAPIDTMIEFGIIKKCVECLSSNTAYPELQFEAAWILTNISSGDLNQTQAVVDCKAIAPLIQMVSSPIPNISEQAIWTLANIAGDGHLDSLGMSSGLIPTSLQLLQAHSNEKSFVGNVTFLLSNLCRAKDPPLPDEAVALCLPAFAALLKCDENEIICDAAWALAYLAEGNDENIQRIIDSGDTVQQLVKLLASAGINNRITLPVVRTLGNLITGTDAQTQIVLDAGLMPLLAPLLGSERPKVVKEAAWAISNIGAGTKEQVQALFDHNIIEPLVQTLRTGEYRSQKEAVHAIANITVKRTAGQMDFLLAKGIIPALCNLLTVGETRIVSVALDAIQDFLKHGFTSGHVNEVKDAIEECGGLDKLEELQTHRNESIYDQAVDLIEVYFNDESDEDEEDDQVDCDESGLGTINEAEFEMEPDSPDGMGDGAHQPFNF